MTALILFIDTNIFFMSDILLHHIYSFEKNVLLTQLWCAVERDIDILS